LALHLRHPNPLVTTLPLPLQDTFAGAVILSPWLSLHVPAQAVRADPTEDVLDQHSLAGWAAGFLGGAPSDPWNDPLTAPRDWWSGLPFEDILLLYGQDELLRDDGATLAGLLEEAHPSVVAVGVPGEVHVHMVMNRVQSLLLRLETARPLIQMIRTIRTIQENGTLALLLLAALPQPLPTRANFTRAGVA
ncbi:hypothetical protein E4U43_000472, partial [Claviceps pusilla]